MGFSTMDELLGLFMGLLAMPGAGAATPRGRYLVTSLWVAPRCIISFASLSNIAKHVGHFLVGRMSANSVFSSLLK